MSFKTSRKRHGKKQLKAQITQYSSKDLIVSQTETFPKFPSVLLERSFVLSILNYRKTLIYVHVILWPLLDPKLSEQYSFKTLLHSSL